MSEFSFKRIPYLQTAAVDFSSSGDNTVVAATAGKRVLVHRLWFVVAGDTNIVFKNGSTAFSGTCEMKANGSFMKDQTGEPWFRTTPGEAFIINSSAAVRIGGMIYYTVE